MRVFGHRQTKGAATDKPNLMLPRHNSTLPDSVRCVGQWSANCERSQTTASGGQFILIPAASLDTGNDSTYRSRPKSIAHWPYMIQANPLIAPIAAKKNPIIWSGRSPIASPRKLSVAPNVAIWLPTDHRLAHRARLVCRQGSRATIWPREGLKVPKKQKPRGRLWLNDGSCVRLRAERPNHVWSSDFVSTKTHDGRSVRLLTLVERKTP